MASDDLGLRSLRSKERPMAIRAHGRLICLGPVSQAHARDASLYAAAARFLAPAPPVAFQQPSRKCPAPPYWSAPRCPPDLELGAGKGSPLLAVNRFVRRHVRRSESGQ